MRDTDLVLAGQFGECSQDLFDLFGEYIDALDLHHVVTSSGDRVDAGEFAAAGALAGNDPGQVVCAETNERSAFLDQCRDDDLSPLSVGHVFAGCRVNDLQIQIVIPIVHACVVLAVDADTGTVDLCQAVNVVEFDAELFRDPLAHLLAPSLGTDHALPEVNLVRDPALLDLLRQKERIG